MLRKLRQTIVDSGNTRVARRNDRGTALVLALSLLAIFGILGSAYVRYMSLELVKSDIQVREARAEHLASAGVQIALEGLRQEVLNADRYNVRGVTNAFDLTTYEGINVGDGGVTATELGAPTEPDAKAEPRLAEAKVTIYDESCRINVNHAPAGVLQRALNIDANTARAVASSVPAGATGPDSKWMLALDELVGPSRLTQDQFNAVDRSKLTVFSVLDHRNPVGHFNVNEAEPVALAAMLNVTEEQATQIKAKGPFSSITTFGEAVTAVTGAPFTGGEAAPALGLTSRCFRIVSEGRYAKFYDSAAYASAAPGEKSQYLSKPATGYVEAVVLFHDDGSHEVLYWSTSRESAATGTT